MADKAILECLLTSWNELVYFKEVLPRYLNVASRIVIVDDYSTDGTKEWIEGLKDPRICFIQKKFETCPLQYQTALEHCSKDVWIWACNPDEIPTDFWFENIIRLLTEADSENVDRIWSTIFHMRSLNTMSSEIGQEIRLYKNDTHHAVKYVGDPHERIDGKFDGHVADSPTVENFATIHFKQFDKKKLEIWKHDYVEKLVYSAKDINRRLKYNTIALPTSTKYTIGKELRDYLCSQ